MQDFVLTDEQKDWVKFAKDFAEKELKPIVAEYDRRVCCNTASHCRNRGTDCLLYGSCHAGTAWRLLPD